MKEKKILIVLILKILENESDEQHPLTQGEIAQLISYVYPCERKTVGRNIQCLIKLGYPVEKTTKGFYMSRRKFTHEERNFVINAVRSATGKTEAAKEDLANRLSSIMRTSYRLS